MPKSFDELSLKDINQIRLKLESVFTDYLYSKLGSYYTIRTDKNNDYAVLEYKLQHNVTTDLNDFNNPHIAINIYKDFSCTTNGFNSEDENFIQKIIHSYLKSNDFLR